MFNYETFKTIILILKNFNLQEINNTLSSTSIHHEKALQDYLTKMQELKQMMVNVKSYETELIYKGNEVQYYDIQTWIPIFQLHQKTNIFPETQKQSVKKITEGKKEIDNINLSIEEANLRLKNKAKEVQKSLDGVKKLESQMKVLQAAADVEGFLNARGFNAKELADYELPNIYTEYQRAGEISGSV